MASDADSLLSLTVISIPRVSVCCVNHFVRSLYIPVREGHGDCSSFVSDPDRNRCCSGYNPMKRPELHEYRISE